jgi:hypothetical protein
MGSCQASTAALSRRWQVAAALVGRLARRHAEDTEERTVMNGASKIGSFALDGLRPPGSRVMHLTALKAAVSMSRSVSVDPLGAICARDSRPFASAIRCTRKNGH